MNVYSWTKQQGSNIGWQRHVSLYSTRKAKRAFEGSPHSVYFICRSSIALEIDEFLRLRDMSHETEQENRRRIAEMEKDVTGVDILHCKSFRPCHRLSYSGFRSSV
jgi:hypothetical protein